MTRYFRLLVRLGCFSLVLATSTAILAADQPNSLGALVKSAHEQLAAIRSQLGDVERYVNNASRGANTGYGGSIFAAAGRGQFTDLDRSARDLAEIGNDVVHLTAKCVEESRSVAVKFRSYVQRVRSGISQIESASSENQVQMTVSKVRRDLDSTEEQLESVAGLSGSCSN
ncbi:MAG TPA: hypothetical protein VEZ88_01785 [Steroidobacteraceae bacterium]|nr:hypothetical protein [Steroidobacteraceae bacterium]